MGAGDFAKSRGLARPKGPPRGGLQSLSHRAKPAPSLGSSRPHPRGGRVNRLGFRTLALPASSLARPLAFRASPAGSGGATGHRYARSIPPCDVFMEAFLVSAGLVAIAEIGDKTQLLAMILATRYRKPVPIILGILVATLANHALAAWAGAAAAGWLGAATMRWIVGALFLAMAGWCLIPDKADEGPKAASHAGAFLATTIAFFLVEIGDKTQIATVALAAR